MQNRWVRFEHAGKIGVATLAGTQVIDLQRSGEPDRRLTQELGITVVVEPA